LSDETHTIITRAEARLANLKRYFTGVPCGRGHISERYVVGCRCIACATERDASDKGKAGHAAYLASDKGKATRVAWKASDKGKAL
jgi:hypothetical protein